MLILPLTWYLLDNWVLVLVCVVEGTISWGNITGTSSKIDSWNKRRSDNINLYSIGRMFKVVSFLR